MRQPLRFLFSPVSRAEIAILVGCILAVLVYCGVPRVTVRNTSAVTLTSLSFSGQGFTRSLDALPPGASHTFWFLPSGDTSIERTFRARDRLVRSSHGYYSAPPIPHMPATLTIDAELRTHYASQRLARQDASALTSDR